MRAYRFLGANWGLSAIHERRLRLGRINELNDPFELAAVEQPNEDIRRDLKAGKDRIHDGAGILCFSSNWHSPLQWAHYAGGHTGICLGFDTEIEPEKVEYIKKPMILEEEITVEIVQKLLRTKFHHWGYEEEYRILVELKEKEGEHYFNDFEGNMTLKEVILGFRSTPYDSIVVSKLIEKYSQVDVFKVTPDYQDFKMVRVMWLH